MIVTHRIADDEQHMTVLTPLSFRDLLTEQGIPFRIVGNMCAVEYTPESDRLYLQLWNDLTDLRAAWLAVCQNRHVAGDQLGLPLNG